MSPWSAHLNVCFTAVWTGDTRDTRPKAVILASQPCVGRRAICAHASRVIVAPDRNQRSCVNLMHRGEGRILIYAAPTFLYCSIIFTTGQMDEAVGRETEGEVGIDIGCAGT